jgi:hypothetical protein
MRALKTGLLLVWWSPVKYLAPVFLAIDMACLWSRDGQWRGEWTSTIDWAGASLLILGPTVAGAAAWRIVSSSRGLGEAADVGGAGWRANRVEALSVFVWACVAHLVTVLVAVALTASRASGAPNPLPVLPQLALLLGYVGIGAAIANLISNPLVAPLVVVVLIYLVTQFSPGSVGELWVSVGGATTSLAQLHYNPHVLAAQTILGIVVGLLAMTVRRSTLGRVELRPVLLSISVLPAVAVAYWLGTGPQHYLFDDTLPDLVCTGHEPTVCTTPASGHAVRPLQVLWSQEAAVLRASGVSPVPGEFDGVDSATTLPAGHRSFSMNDVATAGGQIDAVNATLYLLVDRGRCLTGSTPPPAVAISRLQVAAAYLLAKAGLEPRGQQREPVVQRLVSMPQQRAMPWLRQVFVASAACDFDAVPTAPGK